MKNSYLGQAWLVLALAVGFGAALAGVDVALSSRIAQNKQKETGGQVPALVPGATGSEQVVIGDKNVYKAIDAQGKSVGWVIPANGQGFADKIGLLIGLDTKAEKITGLYVLEQKETPGLGNKIEQQDFRQWFEGQKTDKSLEVVKQTPEKGAYKIRAVTGATVSSESICAIVNQAVEEFKNKLSAEAGGK